MFDVWIFHYTLFLEIRQHVNIEGKLVLCKHITAVIKLLNTKRKMKIVTRLGEYIERNKNGYVT